MGGWVGWWGGWGGGGGWEGGGLGVGCGGRVGEADNPSVPQYLGLYPVLVYSF